MNGHDASRRGRRHRPGHGLALVLVLGIALPAGGQVNIEKLRGSGTQGLDALLEIDLGLRSGSVDRQDLAGELHLEHGSPAARTLVVAQGELGWQNGARYSNEGLVHLRHARRLRKRLEAEAFGQADYARQRRLAGRVVAGAGLRLALHDGDQRLFWGSAYMLEHEANDLPPGARHSRRTTHHRWSNYLSGSLPLSAGARMQVTAYVQPRFDEPKDLRLLGEVHMAVDVVGPARVSLNGSMRYDSDPVDGVEALDAGVKMRLGLRF